MQNHAQVSIFKYLWASLVCFSWKTTCVIIGKIVYVWQCDQIVAIFSTWGNF